MSIYDPKVPILKHTINNMQFSGKNYIMINEHILSGELLSFDKYMHP